MQPPARDGEVDAVQHVLGAVREAHVVELERALDPAELARRRGASAISGSVSRTELIFTIAAVADCSCP